MAQKVRIIGVPMDLGQSRRGVDMGPSALRGAGLQSSLKKLGLQVEDIGNLSVKQPEEMPVGEKRAKYLQEIAETCADVAAAAEKSLNEGFLPLVLGGDHSIAAGVAAGVANYFRRDKKQIGYLWLDAHGDLNTPETTPSGNVHGMPLAAALGLCDGFARDGLRFPAVDPQRVALVGVRSLDPGEQALVRGLGVAVYTISDLDRRGMEPVINEALERVAGGSFVHVSVDLDVVDPEVAPGVGDPVRGGLSYREAHLALELVAEAGVLDAFDLVEVNPIR